MSIQLHSALLGAAAHGARRLERHRSAPSQRNACSPRRASLQHFTAVPFLLRLHPVTPRPCHRSLHLHSRRRPRAFNAAAHSTTSVTLAEPATARSGCCPRQIY